MFAATVCFPAGGQRAWGILDYCFGLEVQIQVVKVGDLGAPFMIVCAGHGQIGTKLIQTCEDAYDHP